MTWDEVREQYPNCWIVVDAYDSYIEDGQIIITNMTVLSEHGSDGYAAIKACSNLREMDRERHYTFLNTFHEYLDIKVIRGSGLRIRVD